MISRRHGAAALISVAIAAGVLWYLRDRDAPAPSAHAAGADRREPPTAATPTRSIRPPDHVAQVGADERGRIADAIAAARAARAAHSAPARPTLLPPEDHEGSHDLDRVGEHVLDALKEAIPFLAACYEQHGSGSGHARTATARMTLTGDPDIGTVIDADQIHDADQHPLDPALDACLRNTMQTLELPPLDEGDAIQVEYSFDLGD